MMLASTEEQRVTTPRGCRLRNSRRPVRRALRAYGFFSCGLEAYNSSVFTAMMKSLRCRPPIL